MNYFDIFWSSASGTSNWVCNQITLNESIPITENYFYGIIAISLIIWVLEIIFPWRKQQSIFRKDFWLDGFYMFFNIFIFSIIIYGFYEVITNILAQIGLTTSSLSIVDIKQFSQFTMILMGKGSMILDKKLRESLSLMCKSYLINETKESIGECVIKLNRGLNKQEVVLVPKKQTKRGFFERLFHFFN